MYPDVTDVITYVKYSTYMLLPWLHLWHRATSQLSSTNMLPDFLEQQWNQQLSQTSSVGWQTINQLGTRAGLLWGLSSKVWLSSHWNERTTILMVIRIDPAAGESLQNSFCGGGSYQEVKDNLKMAWDPENSCELVTAEKSCCNALRGEILNTFQTHCQSSNPHQDVMLSLSSSIPQFSHMKNSTLKL